MEGEELAELQKLHDSVYEQATSWFTSLKDNMKSQILSHFGHLPGKDPDPQVRHTHTHTHIHTHTHSIYNMREHFIKPHHTHKLAFENEMVHLKGYVCVYIDLYSCWCPHVSLPLVSSLAEDQTHGVFRFCVPDD